jgi:hypothetical protein
MSRSIATRLSHSVAPIRCLTLVAIGLVTLLVLAGASPAVARAARLPDAESVRDSRDYVFTIGIIAGVTDRTVTLRFEDGQTETYTLDASTTIQTQNGDAQRLADLKAGNMAMVLSVESTTTAVTIVNGGDAGFHEATPADIRGHEDDACEPSSSPAT